MNQKENKTCSAYPWIACRDELPPIGVVVMTKLDEGDGCLTIQSLMRTQKTPESRSVWFMAGLWMRVHYEPTHWTPMRKEWE